MQFPSLKKFINPAEIFARVLHLRTSNFARHSGLLFVASCLANVIAFVGVIVLARLYPIDALGHYYALLAMALIGSFVGMMGYNAALPVVEEHEVRPLIHGIGIMALSFIIITVPIGHWYAGWWFILSLVSLDLPTRMADILLVRHQKIRAMATLRICTPLILYASISLQSFVIGPTLNAILLGHLLGAFISMLAYGAIAYSGLHLYQFNPASAISMLRKYFHFCRFMGPGFILYSVTNQIPVIIAANFFNPAIAAQYNLAQKFTFAPMVILSDTISRVYTGYLSRLKASNGNLFNHYVRLRTVLAVIGLAMTITLLVAIPIVVHLFFKTEWRPAIWLAYALLPLTFGTISFSPLTNILMFINKQHFAFYMHLASLALAISTFGFAVWISSFISGVLLFSCAMLAMSFYTLYIIENKYKKIYGA